MDIIILSSKIHRRHRVKKCKKTAHQSQIAPPAAGGSAAGSNESDVLELHPSSPEGSGSEDEAEGSAGIISLNVGGNDWRVDDALNSLDPRGAMADVVRNPLFTLPPSFRQIIELNPVDYVDLFFHKQLFSTMVEFTNANISDVSDKVDTKEMRCFIGIMFAMTICPMSNGKDYWNTEDDGLKVAPRFFEKLHMSQSRFSVIRKNWAIAPVQRGSKTFDSIRPLFDMFNEQAASVFRCGTHVVIDESTSGWHGKDEKRADGPPALTHMKGKPEAVSLMIKNVCDVHSGVMFAIELQEGKDEMAKRRFVDQGEKPTTACVLRLMEPLAGSGVILHGDSWFASLNTLQKLKGMGIYFVGLIKTAHSGIPVKWLRRWFTAASVRGETKTVHLGDGLDRIYAHAWNEPGWKAGKPPKKAQNVWIAKLLQCNNSCTLGQAANVFGCWWHCTAWTHISSTDSAHSRVFSSS